MTLSIGGFIIAEGNEVECAVFTHALLESFRLKNEMDKQKEAEEWLKKFGNMTFDELLKRERDEEK